MEHRGVEILPWLVLLVAAAVVQGGPMEYACSSHDDGDGGGFEFCDRSLSIDQRVERLVSLLRLEEKIGLMVHSATAVARLGIPAYQWQNEGLHGLAYSPGIVFDGPSVFAATSFPQPILTASSFNRTLFNQIGQAISTEARAFHNLGQGGLTYWTPNINLFRDPRWGRGQETPGEDPLLTSIYAEYFVRGLQEEGDYDGDSSRLAPTRLKVSACCKHFAAYDLDNWAGIQRYGFNAVVTDQDLADTFNPPFQSCIQDGQASGLMCSYNAVNGIPSCANPHLLTTIARGQWGFDGYIVSDCDAVQTIYANQKYADPEHAVAVTLKAGMDVNCGDTYSNFSKGALEKNLISEAELDVALKRSFKMQFRLGLFDGNPLLQSEGSLGKSEVCSEEHKALALEAAVQSIVLLKNEDHLLPFDRDTIQKLAVIGPNANDTLRTMVGSYSGPSCQYVTPIEGLQSYTKEIQYVAGCSNTACETLDDGDTIAAADAAANADATIIVVGLGQEQETEALDRSSLLLPGQQQKLILAVAMRATRPVVVVVMSGGPVDISFARDEKRIGAIFWVGYPGEAGGQALAQLIFGDRNPGGKLTISWYPEAFTLWPMTTMSMRPDISSGYPGRTYRFYTGEAVYRFGEGLSYSNFTRSFVPWSTKQTPVSVDQYQVPCFDNTKVCIKLDPELCQGLEFTANVSISNTHPWRAGSDVVMLYSSPPGAGEAPGGQPLKQLFDFQRVNLEGDQTISIQFRIRPCTHMATVQLDGTKVLLQGTHIVSLNDDQKLPIVISA